MLNSNFHFGVMGTLIGLIRLIYTDFFMLSQKKISVNQSYQSNQWVINPKSGNYSNGTNSNPQKPF